MGMFAYHMISPSKAAYRSSSSRQFQTPICKQLIEISEYAVKVSFIFSTLNIFGPFITESRISLKLQPIGLF